MLKIFFQEECIDVLKVVKARINSQHEDISSHLLLSIFKIAEVDVVYPTPPSSAISDHRPTKIIIYVITVIITLYNLKQPFSFLFLALIFLDNIVNFIANLFNKVSSIGHKSESDSFDAPISTSKDKYFVKESPIKENKTILKMFKYIEDNTVKLVTYDRKHIAPALISNAQINNDTNTVTKIDVRIKVKYTFKKMKHIIKAVSITILTKFNELVANVIILKYFSRDVYYIIEYTIETKLFGDLSFGKIASSSYGIVQSVSLGLNLV